MSKLFPYLLWIIRSGTYTCISSWAYDISLLIPFGAPKERTRVSAIFISIIMDLILNDTPTDHAGYTFYNRVVKLSTNHEALPSDWYTV